MARPSRRTVLGWPLLWAAAPLAVAAPSPAPEVAFRFDPRFFAKKRPPGPSDWLSHFREPGQSFTSYVTGGPVRPTARRRTIVLQPIGAWSGPRRALVDTIAEFTGLFFASPVRIAPPLPLPGLGFRRLPGDEGGRLQYRTGVLLDQVLAPRLPQDALALLGVTMADLFPDPSWNYVFGQARFTERIGVYSLLRYTPEFHEQPDSPEAQALLLRRSLKVVAHETGHMVSMAHCPFYECLMNGVNSLAELDRGPIWLCPVCLRKLQWNLKLDLRDRYRRLGAFLHRHGLGDWASWADGRLALLQGAAEDAAGSPGR